MKALTLTQPWATLVAIRAKRFETRSWSTTYRGEIAIHASSRFPEECRRLCLERPFLDVLYPAGFVGAGVLPVGAIIAVARVVNVVKTQWVTPITGQEDAFGDFSPGRSAWLLADIRRLPAPIPCKGALGIWTVPADIEALIVGERTQKTRG